MSAVHSERPVESAQELDELTRLRATLSYADWKAHSRHRTERVMREAQRRWGVPAEERAFWTELLPASDEADSLDKAGADIAGYMRAWKDGWP